MADSTIEKIFKTVANTIFVAGIVISAAMLSNSYTNKVIAKANARNKQDSEGPEDQNQCEGDCRTGPAMTTRA